MWFVVFFSTLALLVIHAVWFSGCIARALAAVFPRSERWLRRGRAAYIVVATSVPAITVVRAFLLDGSRQVPPGALADALVVFPFWLVTIHAVQTSLVVVPVEIAHAGLRKAGVLRDARWRWRKSVAVVAVAAVFAVYVPVRIAVDDRALAVRTHVHASAEVPPELDGFRIALIADMQADRYTRGDELAAFVSAVNRQDPDLIVIAGDMIGRGPDHISRAAEHAGALAAPHGVLAAIGDHDNFAYDDHDRSVREVTAALADRGVSMLDDEVRTVEVGDARLAVILATNNYIERISPETTRALLDRAAGADVSALVTHQTSPRLLGRARDAGTDLVLTGHTHGGQLNFWLPFTDLSTARLETPYVSGAYDLGDMLLVTTSGIGMSIAPLRYRAPATIDIIRLERR